VGFARLLLAALEEARRGRRVDRLSDDDIVSDGPGDADRADHIQFVGVEEHPGFQSLRRLGVISETVSPDTVLDSGDAFGRPALGLKHLAGELGGSVVVEIGYNMRDAVISLLERDVASAFRPTEKDGRLKAAATFGWTDIEVRLDLRGIPRVVSASKTGG